MKYYTTIIVNNTTMLQCWVYWMIFILGHSCHIWYRCIYIYIYIFVYVFVKLTIFFLFFVTFKCNVFSALHAKHFDIWKNILWNWWVDYFILRPMEWCDDGCSEWIYFPFYEVFFFSRKLPLVSLSFAYYWVNQLR